MIGWQLELNTQQPKRRSVEKKTMQTSFNNYCAVFLRSNISDIISEVLKNANSLAAMPLEARVDAVLNAIGVPEVRQTYNSAAPILPASATALSTLGGVKAPPKVASAGKTVTEGLSLSEYMTKAAAGACICAYMSNRGQMKDKVCGKVATAFLDQQPSKWRCTACVKKLGILEKSMSSVSLGKGSTVGPISTIPSISIVPSISTNHSQPTFSNFPTIPIPTNLPKIAGDPSGIHVPVCQTAYQGIFTVTKPGFTRLVVSERDAGLFFEGKLQSEPQIENDLSHIPENWADNLIEPNPEDYQVMEEFQILRDN